MLLKVLMNSGKFWWTLVSFESFGKFGKFGKFATERDKERSKV